MLKPPPSNPAIAPGPAQAAAPATAAPALSPAERADIQALIAAEGGTSAIDRTMAASMNLILPALKRELPPGAYQDRLLRLFMQAFLKRVQAPLTELLAHVIARHYTDQEIRQLTAFYLTPLGQKMVAVRPAIMADMGAKSRQLGARLGRQCMLDVLAAHPGLKAQLRQAAVAARNAAAPQP